MRSRTRRTSLEETLDQSLLLRLRPWRKRLSVGYTWLACIIPPFRPVFALIRVVSRHASCDWLLPACANVLRLAGRGIRGRRVFHCGNEHMGLCARHKVLYDGASPVARVRTRLHRHTSLEKASQKGLLSRWYMYFWRGRHIAADARLARVVRPFRPVLALVRLVLWHASCDWLPSSCTDVPCLDGGSIRNRRGSWPESHFESRQWTFGQSKVHVQIQAAPPRLNRKTCSQRATAAGCRHSRSPLWLCLTKS